eukprot:1159130-Pelagomonas_calceolata.AAC.22
MQDGSLWEKHKLESMTDEQLQAALRHLNGLTWVRHSPFTAFKELQQPTAQGRAAKECKSKHAQAQWDS